jgi:hypothetical protein
MQAIEITVYITLGIIVGFMVLNFVFDINYSKIFEKLNKDMTNDQSVEFKSIKKDEIVSAISIIWEQSGMCEMEYSRTINIEGLSTGDTLTKEYIFEELKALNFCSSLQSATYDCGTNEDIYMPNPISLPKIVRISCNINEHYLIIQ